MNIGQLKAVLESQPLDRKCAYGFGTPHSYRGYYEQVAFAEESNVTIREMLGYVNRALTEEFIGWKGGEYRYNLRTPVNIALPGVYNGDEDEYFPQRIMMSILGIE